MIFTLSLLISTLKELSSTEYCSLYYNFRNSRTIEYLRFMKNEINFYKKTGANVLTDWHLVQMDENGIEAFLNSN